MNVLYKLFLLSSILFICQIAVSQNGVTFVGHLDQKHGGSGGDYYSACWGYNAPDGREYAILGTYTGTAIIDISNTSQIKEKVHISGPSSVWREMRTYKDRAYVVSEGGSGVQIIDLSHLPDTAKLIRNFTYSSGGNNITRNHTIEIFDGYMYLNGSAGWGNEGVLIFSLAKVDTPVFVGQYQQDYAHDCYVKGNRLYAAGIYGSGVNIADISNKANPVHLATISYSGAGTHNMWTTTNGNYLFTTDEIGSTAKNLKVWNVQSISPPPSSTSATYTVSPADIVHNVFVRGNYAYVAWYTAGIAVANISSPTSPTTAGYYDTSTMPSGDYNGVWACYPFFWSGKIIAGDMQNGLYVLKFNGLVARTPSSLLQPVNQQAACTSDPVTFRWTRVADPVADPHTYTFRFKGTGIDTSIVTNTDTTVTLNNIGALANGTYKWYVVTKDEVTEVATRDTFSFVKTVPSVAVSSPNGGEIIKSGSTAQITWSAPCIDSIELSYSTDNGSSWNVIESSLPASPATYSWIVPTTPTTQGRVRIRNTQDTTMMDLSNSAFEIFLSRHVNVVTPNGGETWTWEMSRIVEWTYENISNVKIELSTNGGGMWTTLVEDTAASTASVTVNSYLASSLSTSNALIRVSSVDFPSVADTSNAQFTILATTATLQLLSPNGGEVWDIGSQRSITWSNYFVDSLTIQYSIDSGSTWIPVVTGFPADSGHYDWTVPGPQSHYVLLRISDSSDSTIVDESDASFSISQLSFVAQGSWNILSIPVVPDDSTVAGNYPGASSNAFSYNGSYSPLSNVVPGQGFWMKFDAQTPLSFFGELNTGDTISVNERWNIVGSLSVPAPVSGVVPIPGTITLSNFYGFNPDSGYFVASTLQPGYGYWVKSSESGELVLNPADAKIKPVSISERSSLTALIVKDRNEKRRALYIGVSAENAGKLASELPPAPPEGIFDVRFASQQSIEWFDNNFTSKAIVIHSAEYPLTLSLTNASNDSRGYRLVERSNKEILNEYILSSAGVTLTGPPKGTLFLESMTGEGKPEHAWLAQNYPNPFNPSTKIYYALPEAAFVTLKVFNILGEEVGSLINERQEPGVKTIEFTPLVSLPSGIYYYTLNAGSFTATKKMMLVR